MDNNFSLADMAAVMKNGNGDANGIGWNSPMWLLWAIIFGGGNGFGFGNRMGAGVAAGDVQAANNAAQIQNLQDLVTDNHNNDLVMQAIGGSTAAITQLAGVLNVSTDRISTAINVMSQQLQSGQCGIKTEILSQGYQNQLANCQQTNAILNGFAQTQNQIGNLGAALGYQIQTLGCEIEKTTLAQTQSLKDMLSAHWSLEQQGIISSLQSQLSEQKILNAIANKPATATT